MSTKVFSDALHAKFAIDEREHAAAILKADFPAEFADIVACLESFWLRKSAIEVGGGARSKVSQEIDNFLGNRGWKERAFDTKMLVDGREIPSPTHKIDNFKNRVGVEVEWNNKTEFYDRDLNNFRLLRQLHVLSVGVIITRCTELQQVFASIGRGGSFGASTTHWDKLIPKVDGGGAGGCPLLMIGIRSACYNANL